ncbi:MAG: hypothetical protein AAF663_10275, partial [Planctomycetota bacterium]
FLTRKDSDMDPEPRDREPLLLEWSDGLDMPRLSPDDLEFLRQVLAEQTRNDEPGARRMSPKIEARLRLLLSYYDAIRRCDMLRCDSPSCDDARQLLDYAHEIDRLTATIDTLHDELYRARDRALGPVRERVIRSAGELQNRIGTVRDALVRQNLLTGRRKDALAGLSAALNGLSSGLRVSLANGWGRRIQKDIAPPEAVARWEGDFRIVRRAAIDMRHWAEGMAEPGSASASAISDAQTSESSLGSQTARPAEAEDADHLSPLALPKNEQLTLQTLASFDPSLLNVTADICNAMSPSERLSERTVRTAINKLIDKGLAERPEGKKLGARATIKGRKLAEVL